MWPSSQPVQALEPGGPLLTPLEGSYAMDSLLKNQPVIFFDCWSELETLSLNKVMSDSYGTPETPRSHLKVKEKEPFGLRSQGGGTIGLSLQTASFAHVNAGTLELVSLGELVMLPRNVKALAFSPLRDALYPARVSSSYGGLSASVLDEKLSAQSSSGWALQAADCCL